MKKITYILILVLLVACVPSPSDVKKTSEEVPMYPDYTDITIPVNIAPLNFLLRNEADAVCVYANGEEIYVGRGNEVEFDEDEWKEMMEMNSGKTLDMSIVAKYADGWREFKHFTWKIVSDKVDPYMTYRLIEPDYEVFNNLVIQERCVENFEVRNICDYKEVGNKCMNCHTYSAQNPDLSMFYLRGDGGGAILNEGGKLTKLNLKRPEWETGSVYFGFSPNQQYIVFSTNKIIPAFHSQGSKRMEVFDTTSDVYVADLKNHTFISSELLSDSTWLETFPAFSPDGKYIYYCSTQLPDSVGGIKDMKYNLCRIAFDEKTGTLASEVDTVYNSRTEGKSVCHPRISPDGKYLVFTTADYGTFPIWHRESRLEIMDMKTLKHRPMHLEGKTPNVGSDSYHSWSSNSRWLTFASKRDDGLYGKPYYTYIDKKGMCSKPFVLPQAHPTFYDNCLKSFNAPEVGKGKVKFNTQDVKKLLDMKAIDFK